MDTIHIDRLLDLLIEHDDFSNGIRIFCQKVGLTVLWKTSICLRSLTLDRVLILFVELLELLLRQFLSLTVYLGSILGTLARLLRSN